MTVSTLGMVSDLAKVNTELSDLYRRAVGAEEAGAAVPVVKTVLSNLIVYASTEQQAEDAVRNVSEIVGRHPCRAIVIDAMPPQPGEEAATVSVICGITERGDRRLCGEIIRIHVHEPGVGIAGIVMPLLVADVPVSVWAPGKLPAGDANFDELLSVANSIILDSRLTNPQDVAQFLPENGSNLAVMDLCWTSLESWREYTAQHFDPPAARGCLGRIGRIGVRFAPDANADVPSGPLLLASWLIERLGLTVADASFEGGALKIEARRDAGVVRVTISSEESDLGAGEPNLIAIHCEEGGATARFVTRSVSEGELSISDECEGVCLPPRVLEIPRLGEAALAAEALELAQGDDVYESALRVALDILARVER